LIGKTCNDNNPCTDNDLCQAEGICTGTPKTCETSNPCAAAVCDTATGLCGEALKPDNSPSNLDTNLCTQDTCQAGVCTQGPTISCAEDGSVNDQCNTGFCNTSTGVCEKLPKQDGTPCNADDDLCSVDDVCISGVCTAGAAKTCVDLNQCQINGTCDPDAGNCTYQKAPSTTPCDDDNPFCFEGFCCANPCQILDVAHNLQSSTVCCPNGSVCNSFVLGEDPLLEAGEWCEATLDACVSIGLVEGDPSVDFVCCPSGQKCAPLDVTSFFRGGFNPFGDSLGICCADGASACAETSPDGSAPMVEAVCCGSGETCQTREIISVRVSTCCATDACPVVSFDGDTPSFSLECCAAGSVCSTTTFVGTEIGACCPEGQTIIVDTNGSVPEISCGVPSENPCETLLNSDGGPISSSVCCETGEVCSTLVLPLSFPGGGFLGACCSDGQEACLDPALVQSSTFAAVCCDSCSSFSLGQFELPICCPNGGDFCITSLNGTSPTLGCCDGECLPVQSGNLQSATFCCPAGKVPVFDGTDSIDCLDPTG